MREAFEARQLNMGLTPKYLVKTEDGCYENDATHSAWIGFQAGAAYAAKKCEDKARQLMSGPMERAQFATAADLVRSIRAEFPEAFK